MIVNKNSFTFLFLLIVFLKIRFHNAQEVSSTSGNQGGAPSSVNTKFFDPNGRDMGYPNLLEPGRFGNSPSNYQGNPFFPYGNQNGNMQQPQQGYGWNPNAPGPRQPYFQGIPYQPLGNDPRNQGDFPYGRDPNNFRRRPNNYNGFNPNNNMNQRPPYQRPPYPNTPDNNIMYPDNVNRPYQNQGITNQGAYPNGPMQPYPYPAQNGQYYPQQNINGNQNGRPSYPDDISNFPDVIHFPGNTNRPNQPNEYPSQNGLGNQNSFNNVRPNQNNNYPTYPSNNVPSNNMQYPGNNFDSNDGSIHFPKQGIDQGNSLPEPNQYIPGNFNGAPQTQPQLPNNQPSGSINRPNANDTAAILGKPVFVPSTPASSGQAVADGSTASPAQKQCVQDCPSTTEYNPICGTNNVTYINPGRFYCARNCGESVNIRQMGKCLEEGA